MTPWAGAGPNTAPALFTFGDHTIRVVTLEGNPWFVAVDVCRALGLPLEKGTFMHLKKLGNDEKRPVPPNIIWGKGSRGLVVISESGLYKLTLRAHTSNPHAAFFQDWVTREVLPAIRKDGMYVMGEEKVRMGGLSLRINQGDRTAPSPRKFRGGRAET